MTTRERHVVVVLMFFYFFSVGAFHPPCVDYCDGVGWRFSLSRTLVVFPSSHFLFDDCDDNNNPIDFVVVIPTDLHDTSRCALIEVPTAKKTDPLRSKRQVL